MFSIRQTATGWEVLDASGNVIGTEHASYDLALAVIAEQIQTLAVVPGENETGDGLLPESWTSTTGVGFQERLAGGRDFTECAWSSRDPGVYPLPLMHQTSTDYGHFGAVVAGFADRITTDGTVFMSGRFYDTEPGRVLRDMMLDGRRVGVSLDPTEDVQVEGRCTEYDDEGWCVAEDYVFLAYEIGGLTATPFPGFPNATIELGAAVAASPATDAPEPEAEDDAPAEDDDEAVAAAGGRAPMFTPAPMYPPRDWFTMAEPTLGSDLLVEQDDGGLAVPLTITDDGQVFGHVARDGQCHISYADRCVTPPADCRLARFRGGDTVCADGSHVATGPLIAGMDHPVLTMRAAAARDAYAHNGTAWADVTMTNGVFGTWFAGSLRPDVDELQRRVLRAGQVSGDWREELGALDLIAALAVNVPGYGVSRQAIAASGLHVAETTPEPRVLYRGDPTREGVDRRVVAMVSVGMVTRCPECDRTRALAAAGGGRGDIAALRSDVAALAKQVGIIERRTRLTMLPDALAAAAAQIPRG